MISLSESLRLAAHCIYQTALLAENQSIQQALWRRVASTAYYAVFRLIIDDGVKLLFQNPMNEVSLQTFFSREFEHKKMLTYFGKYQMNIYLEKIKAGDRIYNHDTMIREQATDEQGLPVFYTTQKPKMVWKPMPELKRLADCFVILQENRILADYDANHVFMLSDMTSQILANADDFFLVWSRLSLPTKTILVALLLFGDKYK
jgi:hypothetical protein